MAEIDVKKARNWLADAKSSWVPAHDESAKMLAFSHGDEDAQWEPSALQTRKTGHLPVLQFNQGDALVAQVVNPIREYPSVGVIKPVGMAEDVKLACESLTGVLRADENRSGAVDIFNDALEIQVRSGFGAWRFEIDETGERTEINIIAIDDTTTVFPDPSAKAKDYQDARYFLLRHVVSGYTYAERWKDGTLLEGMEPDKQDEQELIVWELLVKRKTEIPGIPQIGDGDQIEVKPIKKMVVDQYWFDESESEAFLEKNLDAYADMIPVVLESAPSAIIGGVRKYFSLTHRYKTPQQSMNFWESEKAWEQATTPRHRVTAEQESLINPSDWVQSSGSAEKHTLYFKKGSQKPEFRVPTPPAEVYSISSDAALAQIRNMSGIFPDPSVQGKMDAPSGIALKNQRAAGGVASYHFVARHKAALRLSTKIHIGLVNKFYDDNEVRESLASDGTATPVSIGGTEVPGSIRNIDITNLKYLVDIDSGASYATQREESSEKWLDFAAKVPQAAPLITYWLLRLSPEKGSEDVADWYKATLPQPIQEAINAKSAVNDDPAQHLQVAMQENAQLKGMMQQMTAHVEEITQKYKELEDKLKKDHDFELQKLGATFQHEEKMHALGGQQKLGLQMNKAHTDSVNQAESDQTALAIEQQKGEHDKWIDASNAALQIELQRMRDESAEYLVQLKIMAETMRAAMQPPAEKKEESHD